MKIYFCIFILIFLFFSCKKPNIGNFEKKALYLAGVIDSTFHCNSEIGLVAEPMESKYELNVLVQNAEVMNDSVVMAIVDCVRNELSPKEAFGKISVTVSQRAGDRVSVGAEQTYTFNL